MLDDAWWTKIQLRWINIPVMMGLLITLLMMGLGSCSSGDEVTPEPTEEAVAEVSTATPTEAAAEPTAEPTATEEPVVEEPTEEPTAEVIEATPTDAPPAATATPEPTATPALVTVDQEGVTFEYDPDLGIQNVVVQKEPARILNIDGSPVYFVDVPEFIRFTMETTDGTAEMYVRPIRDESGQFYASQDADTIAYFNDFETQLVDETDGRFDQQQVAYFPFGDGKALRAVSYQFDAFGTQKITNEDLYYFWDGVTTNGRYYVNLAYPIDASILEASGEFTQEELAAAQADFDAYVLGVLSPLDQLETTDFTPDLTLLDEMMQSLTVAPDASTEISPLANDPNCTNDAVYVRDVTIPDGELINSGERFTKIWEIQNTGSCTWTPAYTATFVNGDDLGWTGFVNVDAVRPGETFQIAVDLTGPSEPGIYEGRWQMINEVGEPFGVLVYVTIVVPEEPVTRVPTPVPAATAAPTATPVAKGCTDGAQFVRDVTIEDGSFINPGDSFVKTWEIRNTGTCTWDNSYVLTFFDGSEIGWDGATQLSDTEVLPNELVQISVQLTAPDEAGIYQGRWEFDDINGDPVGPLLYTAIAVPEDPIATETP